MFLLAHLGITVAIAYTLERKLISGEVKGLDYRLILVGAVLPDIIDKPLSYAGIGGGRAVSHTLLFAVLLTLLVAVIGSKRGRKWAALGFAFSVWVHLMLDSMWELPDVLLWPAYGLSFPMLPPSDPLSLLGILLSNPVLLGGEIVGGSVLLGLIAWKKVYTRPAFRRFLSLGTIE